MNKAREPQTSPDEPGPSADALEVLKEDIKRAIWAEEAEEEGAGDERRTLS